MRLLQSSVFRAVVAVIIGALLVKYRQDTVTWLTIAVGILFFLSGLASVIIYYVNKRSVERVAAEVASESPHEAMAPAFPIGGLGSMVLGVILAFMPATFIRWIVIILGALVVLATIGQFVTGPGSPLWLGSVCLLAFPQHLVPCGRLLHRPAHRLCLDATLHHWLGHDGLWRC